MSIFFENIFIVVSKWSM